MKKDIFLVVLVLICVGLVVALVSILEKANKVNKSLDEERYSRMVAEESLQKNSAKLSTLEAQLKNANERISKVQDLIDHQKAANVDLKKQLQELSDLKADLEGKLKVALEEKLPNSAVNSAAPTAQ